MGTSLQVIPGIGKKMEKHLQSIGYNFVEDLENENPDDIYNKHCIHDGHQVDRCCLYAYRLCVAFANAKARGEELDEKQLLWYNWKD